MAAPASYTETTLRQYMVDKLGVTGRGLELTLASAEIVVASNDVERLIGTTIAAATDMALLEAAAHWQAWLAALSAATSDRDLKAGSASIAMSQRFEHIQEMLTIVRSAWYVELSRSNAATGSGYFSFGLAHGCRGR